MAKNAKRLKESPKTRFELRFDTDVYEAVNKLAEDVGVSLNQLMQGITRWAVDHANLGEFAPPDVKTGDPMPGLVWFDSTGGISGGPVFELDFTERRVVREFSTERGAVNHGGK